MNRQRVIVAHNPGRASILQVAELDAGTHKLIDARDGQGGGSLQAVLVTHKPKAKAPIPFPKLFEQDLLDPQRLVIYGVYTPETSSSDSSVSLPCPGGYSEETKLWPNTLTMCYQGELSIAKGDFAYVFCMQGAEKVERCAVNLIHDDETPCDGHSFNRPALIPESVIQHALHGVGAVHCTHNRGYTAFINTDRQVKLAWTKPSIPAMGNQLLTLSKGDLVLLSPNMLYQMEALEEPCSLIGIHPNGRPDKRLNTLALF